MFSRHPRNFDARRLSQPLRLPRVTFRPRDNVHHHAVEEVEFMSVAEILAGPFRFQVGFCVRSRDNRQVAAE